MLVSGEFVATVVNGSSATHSSGILGYDPSTDTFSANFGGGVYKSEGSYFIGVLKVTPM